VSSKVVLRFAELTSAKARPVVLRIS